MVQYVSHTTSTAGRSLMAAVMNGFGPNRLLVLLVAMKDRAGKPLYAKYNTTYMQVT